MPSTYADSRRRPARGPSAPRNLAAAQRARERGERLVVSFVGDVPAWGPTVYADAGVRYDWAFLRGLQTAVVVSPGLNVLPALAGILEACDVMKGYPVLIDIDAQEVACVVEGRPVGLWPMRRSSPWWLDLFGAAP